MEVRRVWEGVEAPIIGLGCWQLGADWGEVSDQTAFSILDAAYEEGVRFFDTAAGYGGGRSERILGEFRKTHPDITIVTKSGVWRDPADPEGPAKLRNGIEKSLTHLGMEKLDLIQLHCVPTPVMEDNRVWDCLRSLQEEGLIARFGASVETIAEARTCLQQEGLATLQVIFNCFRQRLAYDPDSTSAMLDEAHEKGVGIIVRLPLASGLLSGKFTAETSFPENDHRNYNKDGDCFNVGETFAGLTFDDGLRLVDQIKDLLPGDAPLAQKSIRWIIDHPAVSVIIPGASKVEHVRSNVAAASLPPFAPAIHQALHNWCIAEVDPAIRGVY